MDETINKYDYKILKNKLVNEKNWLNDTLQMPKLIDLLLDKYKTGLFKEEIDNFYKGLEYLKLTNYPNIDNKYKNSRILKGDIANNAKLIRDENGGYDYLNKLDSSYSELSNFITYLVKSMIEDDEYSEEGQLLYKSLISNTRNTLLEFRKEQMYFFANRYLTTIEDYRNNFTEETKRFTSIGDHAESLVLNYLVENDFDILYTGGNGNFIDKVFGVDFIVYHKVYGYKTIQVKRNAYDLKYTFDKYLRDGIDYGIVANNTDYIIYDLQDNYNIINIFNTSYVLNYIALKHNFINDKGISIGINKQDTTKSIHIKKCEGFYKDENHYIINGTFNISDYLGINKNNYLSFFEYIGFIFNDDILLFKSMQWYYDKDNKIIKIPIKDLLLEEKI